jgi:hypothetical protein
MHPQANGKAKSAVKIIKTLITKTAIKCTDAFEAMLEQRNTPRQDTGQSLAQMMFKRKTRAMLPSVNVGADVSISKDIVQKRKARQQSVKKLRDNDRVDSLSSTLDNPFSLRRGKGKIGESER